MSTQAREMELRDAHTKLIKIAADLANRRYSPSLEGCRTLVQAGQRIQEMSDRQTQLALAIRDAADLALAGKSQDGETPRTSEMALRIVERMEMAADIGVMVGSTVVKDFAKELRAALRAAKDLQQR